VLAGNEPMGMSPNASPVCVRPSTR
jgi:hypothetical protein